MFLYISAGLQCGRWLHCVHMGGVSLGGGEKERKGLETCGQSHSGLRWCLIINLIHLAVHNFH